MMHNSSIAKVVSKAEFAQIVNLTKGRISQLIGMGLPLDATGMVPVAEARCWMEDNLNSRRRKSGHPGQKQVNVKNRRDEIALEREEIELQALKRTFIERAVVERTVFGLARAERDAWQTWPLRVAAEIASELGIEEGLVLAVLRTKVREELERLAREGGNVSGAFIHG